MKESLFRNFDKETLPFFYWVLYYK